MQIHESDASRTCEDSGRRESEAVVESTFTQTLEDSAVFGGSGSEENWMAEGDAAEANHAQALAAVFGRFLGRDVLEKDEVGVRGGESVCGGVSSGRVFV